MSLSTSEPDAGAADGAGSPLAATVTQGAPVRLYGRLPVARLAALGDATALLGARLELAWPGIGEDASTSPAAPWLLEADAVLALEESARARLRSLTARAPALLFGADAAATARLAEAGAALTGEPLPLLAGGESRRLTVVAGLSAFEPLDGFTLGESEPRSLPVLLDPDPRAVQPLIAGERGAALGRIARADGGELWVSAVPPLATHVDGQLLRRRFHPGDFLELLPLLAFLRHALGERGFSRPRCRAAFMIDDPNLRSDRYGWVDYATLRDAGRAHGFHTSIAMAAIDAAKTSRRTAALFRAGPELSLVMHGVYHTHHEFARSVTPARARRDLGYGLERMELHRRRHEIACPPVMTFPFSRCSSEWLQAMRDAGLTAAVTGPNPFPFLAEFGALVDPTLGMLPAEMGHGGFPVINRVFLTQPREDLLFAAWLGKPLVVYLHHEDLRDGVGALVEIAEFLNRRTEVDWTDLGTIAEANHQWRQTGAGRVVRMFTGRARLDPDVDAAAVLKPGAERRGDERIWADGRALATECLPGSGVLAALPPGARRILSGPTPRPASGGRRPLGAGFARGRRGLTELRDRLAPVTARVFRDERPDGPIAFPTFTG